MRGLFRSTKSIVSSRVLSVPSTRKPQQCSSAAILITCMLVLGALGLRASAQELSKVEPGHFDYYLLNLSWSPEFCTLHDTDAQCAPRPGFIVHGL